MCIIFTILVTVIFSLVSCQAPTNYHRPSQGAAILSDARYLAGDGTFGAAYSQEDGVEFKEESDEYGNRKGSYSYVDPTGQRRTVSYTAGKDGFRPVGDHIPTARPPVPPQPEYVPLPQYNPPDYRFPQEQFVRPKYQPVQPVYQPTYRRYESQYQPVPTRYDPALDPHFSIRPQFNRPVPRPPFSPLPRPPYQHLSRPQYEPLPRPQYHNGPEYQSRFYPQYQTPVSRPVRPYNEITTQSPRRFNPPGKLDFYRTPDGFSYTFNKS